MLQTSPQAHVLKLPANWPQPDADALDCSRRLSALIQAEIAAHRSISFARFMELALYTPGLGYYSTGTRKLGKAGDFVTAPELSPLFGRCIARQCAQVLTLVEGGDILEIGAGSGRLAVDILLALAGQGVIPRHYFILELSADLRQRQQALLKQQAPHLYERIVWLERLPEQLRGVIVANEVLDAMPVHRFKLDNGIYEYHVGCQENEFVWRLVPATDARLQQRIQTLNLDFVTDYESEISLMTAPWLTSLNAVLSQGLLLLVDYGFPRHEYYHPQRHQGTLMCHYRQRAHDNPLILPGLQDITAHVDFTHVAEVAEQLGLEVAGYTNQAHFLLSCGLMELVGAVTADVSEQWAISQQVKMLTLPSEMGELFKVMALTRELAAPLLGFSERDLCERL